MPTSRTDIGRTLAALRNISRRVLASYPAGQSSRLSSEILSPITGKRRGLHRLFLHPGRKVCHQGRCGDRKLGAWGGCRVEEGALIKDSVIWSGTASCRMRAWNEPSLVGSATSAREPACGRDGPRDKSIVSDFSIFDAPECGDLQQRRISRSATRLTGPMRARS